MSDQDSDFKKIFSSNLVYLRSKAGMTQAELGQKVGVTWSQISRYESGISSPRKGVMLKLADALGVHWSALQHGVEVQPQDSEGKDAGGSFHLDLETAETIQQMASQHGFSMGEMIRELTLLGLRTRDMLDGTGNPPPSTKGN